MTNDQGSAFLLVLLWAVVATVIALADHGCIHF